MLFDRRITVVFHQWADVEPYERPGNDLVPVFQEADPSPVRVEDSRKTMWAHREEDGLSEDTAEERQQAASRNTAKRSYIIRPWQYLKDFGNGAVAGKQGGFGLTRLISEDGLTWWIRGLAEIEGRNRRWRLDCERVRLN